MGFDETSGSDGAARRPYQFATPIPGDAGGMCKKEPFDESR